MRIAILSILAAACSTTPQPEAQVAWAIDWAAVTPTQWGLEGHHIWEFYLDGWEDRHDEDFYTCHLVQELVGEVVSCPEGVSACAAAYALTLELDEDESDCDPSIVNDPSFDGPPWIAIGSLPEALEEDAPYPDHVFGWYLGYAEDDFVDHGYAYAEVMEQEGGAAPPVGWALGEPYVLWPAYAWSL